MHQVQSNTPDVMIGASSGAGIPAYVIDDNPVDRANAVQLARESDFRVRQFESGDAFLAALPGLASGVLLLDVMMPGTDGSAVLQTLKKLDRSDQIIMMSAQADVSTAVATMRHGAQDFLLKPLDPRETAATLARATEAINCSLSAVEDQALVNQVLKKITPKEMVVLRKLIAGKRNKNIAHELGVSERTVEVHRSRLIRRVESGTFAGLIAFAVRAGVEPDTD